MNPVTLGGSPLFLAEVAAIETGERLRPVDPARVEALAASINEIDLRQPIVVRPGPGGSNALRLVAGGHRLAAVKLLGWSEIPAVWDDIDDATARLVEIDENLIRNELSEIDRAVSLAERKRIYEGLHPETAHGKAPKPKKNNPLGKVANLATFMRYSKDAARATGLSERVIQRSVGLIDDLNPGALALIRASGIADNQAQLLRLAKEPREHQVVFARELAEGRAHNVQAARVSSGYHPPGGAMRPAERGLAAFERIASGLTLEQMRAARSLLDQFILLAEEEERVLAGRRAAKAGKKAGRT